MTILSPYVFDVEEKGDVFDKILEKKLEEGVTLGALRNDFWSEE